MAVKDLILPENSNAPEKSVKNFHNFDIAFAESATQTHDFYIENNALKQKLKILETENENLLHEKNQLIENVKYWKNIAEQYNKVGEFPKFFANKDFQKSAQKNYKCDHCEKSFDTNSTLKRHVKNVHKSIKYHKCEICDKEFHNKFTYLSHFNSVHILGQKSENEIKKEFCDYENSNENTNVVPLEEINFKVEIKDEVIEQNIIEQNKILNKDPLSLKITRKPPQTQCTEGRLNLNFLAHPYRVAFLNH